MYRQLKSNLSKLNFLFGRNPKIEKRSDWRKFIPKPYKALVTFTADFELAWAWRYSKRVSNPLQRALEKAKLERENVPKVLEICDKYKIPITWATVGHLFLDKCNIDKNGKAHSEMPRLGNFENEYWKFAGEDWFEYDPCSDYETAPEWYCPDLIDMILNSKTRHEIGCHTFSHIDCNDEVCSKEVFDAEINECKKLANLKGITLKSFVHPGHTIGNLDNLVLQEFTSFQTDPGNIFGYPIKHKNGLWELKRTYEFTYRAEWSVEYHIYRYKKIIDRAIEKNSVCNFWFHPSFNTVFVDNILSVIFSYLDEKKGEIAVMTCGNYSAFLHKGK